MKTVKEVLDEYRNRNASPEIESMCIWAAGTNNHFSNVTNLGTGKNRDLLEFDYEDCGGRKHFSGYGTILNKVVKIND